MKTYDKVSISFDKRAGLMTINCVIKEEEAAYELELNVLVREIRDLMTTCKIQKGLSGKPTECSASMRATLVMRKD